MNALTSFSSQDAWLKARVGRITASTICDLFQGGKGEPFGQYAKNIIAAIAQERWTGESSQDPYDAAPLRWGRDNEPIAREVFESLTGLTVQHDPYAMWLDGDTAGASPDGITSDGGIVEIKCPFTRKAAALHLTLISGDDLKAECPKYWHQMQMNMALGDLPFGYFVSYAPFFPSEIMRLVRVERDAAYYDRLMQRLSLAETEVDKIMDEYQKGFSAMEDLLSALAEKLPATL